MKFLDKLKQAVSSASRVVSGDLGRLNKIRRGLGDQAIDYVLNGRGETVLASIGNTTSGGELEACQPYLMHNSPSWLRRLLLAQQNPFDIEFACRYTEVLSASCPSLPSEAAGTAKAVRDVRVFFSEAFQGVGERANTWPPKPVRIGQNGFDLTAAIGVTKALGGSIVDLVDVLYNEAVQYSAISGKLYRAAVSAKPLLERYPDEAMVAGARLHANSRARLIQDLHEFGLVGHPGYLDFILERAGDSSRAVREVARTVLADVPPATLESKAAAHLKAGNVNMRAGMVDLLSKMGTQTAIAILAEHKEREKTARVIAAIDTALTVSEQSVAAVADSDDQSAYQAIDGTRVEIPPLSPIEDGAAPTFGDDAKVALTELIAKENERIKTHNKEMAKRGYKHNASLLKQSLVAQTLDLFNGDGPPNKDLADQVAAFLTWGPGVKWARAALTTLPEKKAMRIAAAVTGNGHGAFSQYSLGPFADTVRQFITGPNGDIRHVENMDIELGVKTRFGYGSDRVSRRFCKGDLLRHLIPDDYAYEESQLDTVPHDALWPYLAENLQVIDEALGLKPQKGVKLSRVGAIRVLNRLPRAPARYFGPLLEAATAEAKAGRPEARAMLQSAPRIDGHIVALLDDSRQAIRAGAAEWIAARNDTGAIGKMRARLKKEKSELAKAAILTALQALGEDLSGFVGPKALLAEAEAGLKKAKLDKLDWLGLDHLPHVRYVSGRRVPDAVLRWWIFLAVKLKQPGGNALFDIYLERLVPEDAESFSTWLLDSWVNYDTVRPSEEEGNAHARQTSAQHYKAMRQWYKDYTQEQAFADIKASFMANYLNSGAATKGLLALGKKASPAVAADRVRAYLKNHGSRTSQSSSLLEMLAAAGDPVTLQVVIAAATRLKQKGVQKFAGSLVEKVAEAKHWTLDELADRTIPSAGLDEDGVMELPCGPDSRLYKVRLNETLTLAIANPDGKSIKSLPGGDDDATRAAKKQLTASRRELKQVVAMQSARLYEALCSGRSWPLADWRRDLYEHPIMRRLVERAVWFGLNEAGNAEGTFRPTAEGDFTDSNDVNVELDDFHAIRLAYGAEMEEAQARAWASHLDDYEVTPLFVQFGRSLLTADELPKEQLEIDDRKGWVSDTFSIRGAASKLGYERGEAMDGGYFNEYIKGFQSAGILAVIEFSGNCLPEDNVPAAMISLSFEKYASGRRMGGALKLSDVPPVLLSECWNDYRSMVAKAAFVEDWETKMPWM